MCCSKNTPIQTVTVQFYMYFQSAKIYCNTQCVAVSRHRYRPSEFSFFWTLNLHNITVTHNVLLSVHIVTDCQSSVFLWTFNLQIINTNTQFVAVRTHRYRPTHYNLLCSFSVHNITVTHNVLLSEHTVTDRHSTICYVRSVCKTLL